MSWLSPELSAAVEKLTDAQVVALVLYGEARSEPIEGIVAVASVIRNRTQKPARFGEGYRGVCLRPYQFSCLNVIGGKKNIKYVTAFAERLASGAEITDPAELECVAVATCIVRNYLRDNTRNGDHYHAAKMPKRPEWAYGATMTAHRGAHVFYKDVK